MMDNLHPVKTKQLLLTSWNTVYLGYAYPLHWSPKKAVALTKSDIDFISDEDMSTSHR